MIPRIYRRQLRAKLRKFPAVALTGPRQCGKTTLAQQLGGLYFDMETAGSEARLDAEWEALVSGGRLIIIDEDQNAPDVFPRLRGTIDRLNATADPIGASRRVLVCRIARRIETENLLVVSLPVWLRRLVDQSAV